jgi:hypothetical protein
MFMAISLSVTVSIGDETNGVCSVMLRVNLDDRSISSVPKLMWPAQFQPQTGRGRGQTTP